MKRNAFALTLLAAFGFGLLAGPHPCSARHGEDKGRPSSSCHGTKAEHGPSAHASMPSQAPSDCCDTYCRHACHMAAVAEAASPAFAIAPVARSVAETPDPGLPLFTHAIDHVPLA
jgi:hypothetical protein